MAQDYSSVGMIPLFGDAGSMFSLSGSLIQLTEGYVNTLENLSTQIFPPVINVNFPTVTQAPKILEAAEPDLIPVSIDLPNNPAPFGGALVLSPIPGPFTGVAPYLNFGNPPTPFSGIVPASPPIDLNFVYPTVSLTLPTPAQLLTLDTVTFNPLNIPGFNVSIPLLNISPPSVIPYVEPSTYASVELATVQASLISAMTSDTDIGLTAATQQAMWDAAREREYRAQADALAALERDHELLGYAFPPGVFLDSRIKVYTETQNTTAGLSRDIMVKQAELRLENVTKARELAVNLESKLIDYYNDVCQRTFEAVKYYTESQIAIYNAQVQTYNVQLHFYEVEAQVYDTQIKGIQAQIAQMQAQIEFEKTKAEINTALVEQYKAEVDAALAVLEIYKTQVQIIQVEAEVEKIKVDVFSAQIQAFVGQVNAYTAQVEGYKANVQAQGEIENVFKTQVDVYSAEVEAGVKTIEAQVAGYRAQIDGYEATLAGYKAQLDGQVALVQAQEAYNTAEVELFKGEVEALASYNQTLTSRWQAVINEQLQVTEVAVKAAEANGQLYISARQLSLDAAKVGAQVMAQLGAAALNAIHWSNSASWTLGVSSVLSTSSSTSTSTNTNYNSSI
jgi:hypothetical protein